eukprot:TRINITY_DN1354_c0_g1_i5.p1 TRINITY_DN1354_c0_g1~~TRINITY_DN1354_c0_g1_i5.p1  ORF type:complete len:285 (+),score=37.93 TRINITY_DN1354_c0_g1_i5:232-1086(+)
MYEDGRTIVVMVIHTHSKDKDLYELCVFYNLAPKPQVTLALDKEIEYIHLLQIDRELTIIAQARDTSITGYSISQKDIRKNETHMIVKSVQKVLAEQETIVVSRSCHIQDYILLCVGTLQGNLYLIVTSDLSRIILEEQSVMRFFCGFSVTNIEFFNPTADSKEYDWNLLVTTSGGSALIFDRIPANKLGKCHIIPLDSSVECIVACSIDNVDGDGLNEIMITSFPNKLYIIKLVKDVYQIVHRSTLDQFFLFFGIFPAENQPATLLSVSTKSMAKYKLSTVSN